MITLAVVCSCNLHAFSFKKQQSSDLNCAEDIMSMKIPSRPTIVQYENIEGEPLKALLTKTKSLQKKIADYVTLLASSTWTYDNYCCALSAVAANENEENRDTRFLAARSVCNSLGGTTIQMPNVDEIKTYETIAKKAHDVSTYVRESLPILTRNLNTYQSVYRQKLHAQLVDAVKSCFNWAVIIICGILLLKFLSFGTRGLIGLTTGIVGVIFSKLTNLFKK